MHRLAFRTATAKKAGALGHETKNMPSGSGDRATSRPSLRLFRRRTSNTPSLDELASPDRFQPDSSPVSASNDEGDEKEQVEDEWDDGEEEEDASDGERKRLRRARARAVRLRSATLSFGSGNPSHSFSTHQQRSNDGDFDAGPDDLGDDSDAHFADGDAEELRRSSDVGELQRQVRALLHARIQAEDAWRRETARLHEQLRTAEAKANAASAKTTKVSVALTPSGPTPRERELLRLLVRIVGKEQIRALLTEPAATAAANAPAQLRRRLVTRAKASAAAPSVASASRQRNEPLKESGAATTKVSHTTSTQARVSAAGPKVSETMTSSATTAALLLSGTRRHEMSAAM